MVQKLKQGAEGLVIVLIGLFLLVNSLNIPSNPIAYDGWTGVLAQAKFMPLIMSAGILILGVVLLAKQLQGKDQSARLTRAEWFRLGVVLALITAYALGVYWFKFMIPTIVFAFAIIFFLNWKKRKMWVLALVALLAIVLGLYGLPLLINLRLPML